MTAIIGEIKISCGESYARSDAANFINTLKDAKTPHDVRQIIMKKLNKLG